MERKSFKIYVRKIADAVKARYAMRRFVVIDCSGGEETVALPSLTPEIYELLLPEVRRAVFRCLRAVASLGFEVVTPDDNEIEIIFNDYSNNHPYEAIVERINKYALLRGLEFLPEGARPDRDELRRLGLSEADEVLDELRMMLL